MPTKREKANQEGLEELRRVGRAVGAGPPGAVVALPGRLCGRYAKIQIESLTLEAFDWSLEWEVETFDATAHGERWKVWVAGDQQWTARCRGYFKPSDVAYIQAAALRAADPGVATTVKLYPGIDTSADNNAIFIGDGIITRASFNAPMAMVVQEMEVRGSGIPTDIKTGAGVDQ